MLDPKHKSSMADRNPKITKTLLGATKTAATMTMTTDGEDRRRKKEREGGREGKREKGLSLGEGDGRRSSCFVWSRSCTMQNSASNSKAVRQSATSLFARCESSRFFRGANRSLNPNERLRARKREKTRKEFAEREQRRKGYIQWARTVDRPEVVPPNPSMAFRDPDTSDRNYTKMSNI